MKKSFGVIIAFVFIFSAHSTLAGELVDQSTRLIDGLNLPILSGLRRPSSQPYSFSGTFKGIVLAGAHILGVIAREAITNR